MSKKTPSESAKANSLKPASKSPEKKPQAQIISTEFMLASLAVIMVIMLLSVDYWRTSATALLQPIFGDPSDNSTEEWAQLSEKVQLAQEQRLANKSKFDQLEQTVQEHQQAQQTLRHDILETQKGIDDGQSAALIMREEITVLEAAMEGLQQSARALSERPQDRETETAITLASEVQSALARMNLEITALKTDITRLSQAQRNIAEQFAYADYWNRVRQRFGTLLQKLRVQEKYSLELQEFQEVLKPENQRKLARHLSIMQRYADDGLPGRKEIREALYHYKNQKNLLEIPILTSDPVVEDSDQKIPEGIGQRILEELRGLIRVRRVEPEIQTDPDGERITLQAQIERLIAANSDDLTLQQFAQQLADRRQLMQATRAIRQWMREQDAGEER